MVVSALYPELSELLPLLRMHGVKVYRDTEEMTHLEFFESAPEAGIGAQEAAKMLKEAEHKLLCRCGHDLETEHREGLCLHGCDSAECQTSTPPP